MRHNGQSVKSAQHVLTRQESRNIDCPAKVIVFHAKTIDMESGHGKLRHELFKEMYNRCAREDHEMQWLFISLGRRQLLQSVLPLLDEASRKPNAIVELWKTVVFLHGRHGKPCEKVEFITEVDETLARFLSRTPLPNLNLVNDGGRPLTIEHLQRVASLAKARESDGHDGERQRVRPPGHQFLHRAVKLPAIIESRAKHDLRMVLDIRRFQAIEMVCNLGRPPRVEHGGAQIGIHRMDGNEERRQVIAFDPLEILFAHIRQRDEVAIEERHAIIIILDRQALSHARRHLIDEAEVTAVAARAYTIEHG